MPFSEEDRTLALLWSDRHCCLCKQQCGINIVVHHLEEQASGGSDELDNAIPLCFECHGLVGHYRSEHPLGTKYKPSELRTRREQVYEEFTRHLVPPVKSKITQELLKGTGTVPFPQVRFEIAHESDSPPVRALVRLYLVLREKKRGAVAQRGRLSRKGGYYTGKKMWNLNPRCTTNGWFTVPPKFRPGDESELEVVVSVTVVDPYLRPHHQLPVGFVYVENTKSWYVEPCPSFTPPNPTTKEILSLVRAQK